MTLRCVILLASVCSLAASEAIRFAYLPPPPSSENNATGINTNSNTSGVVNTNDTLAQRFGDFNFDTDIRISQVSRRQAERVISRGIQQLTLDLDQVLTSGSMKNGSRDLSTASASNVIFSPLSIAGALALVLLGARGKTYQELIQVLGLTKDGQYLGSEDAIHDHYSRVLTQFDERAGVSMPSQIVSASAIFVQEGYPIFPRYRQLSQSLYKSDVINLDFLRRGNDAVTAVNKWVNSKTRGRIMDFLTDPPSTDTRLIIASALYFNGAWEYPFPEEITSTRPFYVTGDATAPGEVLQVTMMGNGGDMPYYASPTLNCRVLGLPYKGGEVSMYVVLPNKTGISALRELEQKLTPSAIDELVNSTEVQPVIFLIPRMKLESTISLKGALRSLGVESLFNPTTADLSLISPGIPNQQPSDYLIFSRIANDSETVNEVNTTTSGKADREQMVFRQRRQTNNPGLYADDAIHRVEIEITETGTIASAATALSITRDGSQTVFRADRPFLFFIRHDPTGLILFWGSVVRPMPSTAARKRPVKQ